MLAPRTSTVATGPARMKSGRFATKKISGRAGQQEDCRGTRSCLFSLVFDSTALPNSIAKSHLNHDYLVKSTGACSRYWKRTPLISFGRTGVIWSCTFHSCPDIRGLHWHVLHRELNLNGQAP